MLVWWRLSVRLIDRAITTASVALLGASRDVVALRMGTPVICRPLLVRRLVFAANLRRNRPVVVGL